MRLSYAWLALGASLALIVGCVAVYGPCVVDKQGGKAWCMDEGVMVLVPGSTTLDIRTGASAPEGRITTVEKP